jgi:hypothetical protein
MIAPQLRALLLLLLCWQTADCASDGPRGHENSVSWLDAQPRGAGATTRALLGADQGAHLQCMPKTACHEDVV